MTAPIFSYGANCKIVGKTEPDKLSYAGAWQNAKGTLGDLAEHISKGHPWMPALLDGNKKRWQSNANYAELLALDIDEGMTMEQAIAHPLVSWLGLGIESASSTPEKNKFRAVFALPWAIARDPEGFCVLKGKDAPDDGIWRKYKAWLVIRICNAHLAKLWGTADPQCKDPNRFFYGAPGRDSFLLNHEARLPQTFVEEALKWHEEQEAIAQREYDERRKAWESLPIQGEEKMSLVQQALAFIPPRGEAGSGTYGDAFAVVTALVNEFGEDQAIAIAEGWSPSRGDWNIPQKVKSLRRGVSGRSVGLGTLFHLAKQNGFKFPARERSMEEVKIDKGALAVGDRDRLYREILSGLELSAEHAELLKGQGLTEAQIEAGMFRSVGQWQHLSSPSDSRLPGVLRGGRSLNTPGAGFVCPIWDTDGQIIGLQLRLNDPDDGGRYRWLSSKTKKNQDGATPHISGELPLTVVRVEGSEAVALGEGILKPYVAAHKLGVNFAGASGGNFAASPKALKKALESFGARQIVFYQDAGAKQNEKVLRRDYQTWDLLKSWGYEVRVAWWGQEAKDAPDCDELSGEEVRFLTVEEYGRAIAPQPSTLAEPPKSVDEKPKKKPKLPSEMEVARQIAIEFENQVIFSKKHESWFRYEAVSPGAWGAIVDGDVDNMLWHYLNKLVDDGGYEGYSARYMAGVHRLLKSSSLREVDLEKESIEKKHFIGFKNGVYDTHAKKFISGHKPENYLLSSLPRDYEPFAREWGNIFDWLCWMFDGIEHHFHTFNCVAAAMVRRIQNLQVFPHFKGIGGSGKSTVLKVLEALVGKQNTYSSNLEDLADNKFETANLIGKLLCTMPDQVNWHGSISTFLKLTGDDSVRVERKNRDAGTFRFQGFIAMSSNEDVFLSRTGRELTRRQLLIPFDREVSDPDPAFESKLLEGISGWTNYLLSIPEEEIIKTLSMKGRKQVSPEQWESKKRVDSISAWLEECCVVGAGHRHKIGSNKADASTLFGSYQAHAQSSGAIPKGLREFSELVINTLRQIFPKQEFLKKRTSDGYMIEGLELRDGFKDLPLISELLPKTEKSGYDLRAEYGNWLAAAPEAIDDEPPEELEVANPSVIFEELDVTSFVTEEFAEEVQDVMVDVVVRSPETVAPIGQEERVEQKSHPEPDPAKVQTPAAEEEIAEFDGMKVGDSVRLDWSAWNKKEKQDLIKIASLPDDERLGRIVGFKQSLYKRTEYMPLVLFEGYAAPIKITGMALKVFDV